MYGDKSSDKITLSSDILTQMSLSYKKYNEKRQQGENEFISNFLKSLHDELNFNTLVKKIFDIPIEPPILKINIYLKK